MIELDSREVKVGDRLFCLINGWGVVPTPDEHCHYPIEVVFTDGGREKYTDTGFNSELTYRTLFWDEPEYTNQVERQLDYHYDLLYDIKTVRDLDAQVEYMVNRLGGIMELCRKDGYSIDSYVATMLGLKIP